MGDQTGGRAAEAAQRPTAGRGNAELLFSKLLAKTGKSNPWRFLGIVGRFSLRFAAARASLLQHGRATSLL
jgi:hypothetical protein